MKDAIAGLIKRGYMSEYNRDDKRDHEVFPKRKSPTKMVNVVTGDKEVDNKEEDAHKGKHQYIAIITGSTLQVNASSKGTMERKITKLMGINKKGKSISIKSPKRPKLGFWDSEKVEGILNDMFPLMITITISHFDAFQILIDDGSSCDIIYSELFEKIGLKKGKCMVI